MGTQNIEQSPVGSTKKPELVTIHSLNDLKKELKLESLDTSNDKEFEKELNFKILRQDLDVLQAQMIGASDVQKIEKLKSIIVKIETIKHEAGKETGKLKTEMERTLELPPTAENMRKAFELLNEGKYEDAQRYMIISQIVKVFIHGNSFSIKEDGAFIKDYNVIEKDGKRVENFSKILDKYLSKEEFRNARLYEYIKAGTSVDTDANRIASRYNIILNNNTDKPLSEEEKASLRTQILNARDEGGTKMCEEDQMLLLTYIGGDYKKVKQSVIVYEKVTEERGVASSKELEQKTGITWKADYAKNPERLVADVLNRMGPLGILGTVGLIIGKIFDCDVTGEKGNFLMKLFAGAAALGIYKGSGLGDHVYDLMKDKNGARDIYKDGAKATAEYTGLAITWAGGVIKDLAGKIKGSAEELTDRLKFWYDFSKFQYTDSNGVQNDLIKSNFQELYSKTKSGFGTSLIRSDGKKIDSKEVVNLNSKLEQLYRDGVTKYNGDGNKFLANTRGMNIAQVIDNIAYIETSKKPKSSPKSSSSVAPAIVATGAVAESSTGNPASVSQQVSPVGPTQAPQLTKDQIEVNKKELKEKISNLKVALISTIDKNNTRGSNVNGLKSVIIGKIDEFDKGIKNDNLEKCLLALSLFEVNVINQINLISVYSPSGIYRQIHIDRITNYIDGFKIIDYADQKFAGEWGTRHFAGILSNFDLKGSDLTQNDLETNLVYIKLDEKIKKLFSLIPSNTPKNHSDMYKSYLHNELKLQLYTSYSNSGMIFKKMNEEDIDKLNLKSFDDWKSEFKV